jgi:hemolysin activation/secretion protein
MRLEWVPFWLKDGRGGALFFAAVVLLLLAGVSLLQAGAGGAPATDSGAAVEPRFYVKEYRVEGGGSLKRIDIERAVYPYMGPYRTEGDVEKARAALEAAYQAQGFQAVSVELPEQNVDGGVVVLKVSEGRVGKLRVKGSRYYSLNQIKREAGSMQEGAVLNFNGMTRDIVALNQNPDRRITPAISAGREYGTYDVYLNVEDSPPWHGSTELNNRYSADTTALRWNGSVSYSNLWQAGHTIGGSFQTSPEDFGEVKVFSGYYMAPVPGAEWLRLMLQGIDQNSEVSTLGGAAVAGKGFIIGPRAIITLPGDEGFSQNVTVGFDYKDFDQSVRQGGGVSETPVTYVPMSASYGSVFSGEGRVTEFNATATIGLRGVVGSSSEWVRENKTFAADTNFFYLTGDLSHSQDLWKNGMQVYVRGMGQVTPQPLLTNEQFSMGGLDTVRGYLESEALGDNALAGTVEVRSPSLTQWIGTDVTDWRFYFFSDTGWATLNDGSSLAGQDESFVMSSLGFGSRIRLYDHYYGSFDLTRALLGSVTTSEGDMRVLFQLGAQF